MTKPTKWLCSQQRLRSAWALAQSDQSSLCAQWVAKDPSFHHADIEVSDQPGQMPRLIWVLAGRTCHFVGFVMRRLKCCWQLCCRQSTCSCRWLVGPSLVIIWATSWENLFMPYANNKGADQPAYPCSLISTFVVRCLDSIIPLLAIAEISSL